MNRNQEFIKNTIILFIGKFTTQFISLLLLPLYTHYLLTEDYGMIDLLQTYITLFAPILTLRIDSATFRFLIENRKNKEKTKTTITNVIFILLISILITLIIGIIVINLINFKNNIYMITNLIILMVSNVLLQILRGIGKNKEYSIASILTGIITLLTNIILILIFKSDAKSILISSSIANLICIIYIISKIKLFKYFKFKLINKCKIKEILTYSLPMIPNALSWWVVNVSDRTIITTFLGSVYNGIYTISCKFSNILNSIFAIFNMSWQETASLHIDDEDKDNFFTDIINKLLMLFATFSILIVAILPFAFNILIGNNYIDSYKYIPILIYSNLWNILISLIGGIYVAKKRTKEIATTTIYSAIINIIINLLLIKKIGLYAACISTLIAYMIMGIYRYIDCKKYVNIKINIKKLIIYTLIFIISSIIYNINILKLNILNLIIILIYSITINQDIIKIIFKKIKSLKI